MIGSRCLHINGDIDHVASNFFADEEDVVAGNCLDVAPLMYAKSRRWRDGRLGNLPSVPERWCTAPGKQGYLYRRTDRAVEVTAEHAAFAAGQHGKGRGEFIS